MQFRAHLHTVNRHRRLVRRYCLKLGLVWQGLTHDLSKYSPTEFWRGCKYYQGWRSPNDQERLENGVSLAWLHHKGRSVPRTSPARTPAASCTRTPRHCWTAGSCC